MLNLWLISPGFAGDGGVATYARNVAQALAPTTVRVLSFGREARRVDVPSNVELVNETSRLGFTCRLVRTLLSDRNGIFIFGHLGLTRPLVGLPFLRTRTVLLMLHGMEAWTRLPRLRRAGLGKVGAVVYTARFNWDRFSESNGACLRKGTTTFHIPLSGGPELESIRPSDQSQEAVRTVVCISRLTRAEPAKGISTLLKASRLLEPSAWKILVLGDGDARVDYIREAAILDVADRVEFLGWVEPGLKRDVLRRASMLCLPSGQEGFGIVALEALAAGRPVVAANTGALPEVLSPEVAELFDFDDDQALAAALERVEARLANGELQPTTIRRFYEERYSWERFKNSWRSMISQLDSSNFPS